MDLVKQVAKWCECLIPQGLRFEKYRDFKLMAKNTCNKCYGRGWIGQDKRTGKYILCKCVRKLAISK